MLFIFLITLPVDSFAGRSLPVNILHKSGTKLHYSIDVWNTENGLPQNTINRIIQTRDRFMWLATNDGLLRFDGNKFTLYNQTNTPQLGSNRIVDLLEDRNGALWISTENCKISVFRDGQFYEIDDKGYLYGFLASFTQDDSGNVWICTNTMLLRFTNYTISFSKKISLPYDNFRRCIFWDNNTLYIGGSSAFKFHNGAISPIPELHLKTIQVIKRTASGELFFGTADGLYRLVKNKFQYVKFEAVNGNPFVYEIFQDHGGRLWVSADNSFLAIWDKDNYTLLNYLTVSHDHIQTILEDQEGNIWAGTYSSGLIRFKKQNFSTISSADGLSNNFVYPLLEASDGSLYIGTNGGGLNRMKDGKISRVTPNNVPNTWALFEDSHKNIWAGTYGDGVMRISAKGITSYKNKEWNQTRVVFAIAEDHEKNLWFGGLTGLSKYDGKKLIHFTTKDGLINNEVRCILIDSDGTLWIGTSGGISHFDGKVFSNYGRNKGLSSEFVRTIVKDRAGNLWIGTYGGGLNRMKNGKFITINKNVGLFDNNVSTIVRDDFGYYWMTCNKGIYKVSKKNLDDFADGKIQSISCITYDKSDGLLSNECNGGCQPSACKTKNGLLYFPTLKGVAYINPAQLSTPHPGTAPIIQDILIDDKPAPLSVAVTVGPDYERIQINFTSINLTDPKNVRFRYIVDGLFTNWTAPSENRFVLLTKIPPGTYQLRVVSCNDEGIWSEKPAEITIAIRAHFYQTGLFYAILFLLIPVGVLFLALLRIRFLKYQAGQLNELVAERTKDLSNEKVKSEMAYMQMRIAKESAEKEKEKAEQANFQKTELINILTHDLKNPIISINGGASLINECPDDVELVKHMGEIIASSSEHMTELINQLYEHNKLEAFYVKLDKKAVDVVGLADIVIAKNSLQASKKQQTIIFSASVPDSVTVTADEIKMQTALDNLISNAVKYSPAGKTINVTIADLGTLVRVSVKDEGPGLTDDDKKLIFGKFQRLSARPTGNEISTGLGLSIVKQIAELHNWSVRVESEAGHGAEFIIEIPKNGGSVSGDAPETEKGLPVS